MFEYMTKRQNCPVPYFFRQRVAAFSVRTAEDLAHFCTRWRSIGFKEMSALKSYDSWRPNMHHANTSYGRVHVRRYHPDELLKGSP